MQEGIDVEVLHTVSRCHQERRGLKDSSCLAVAVVRKGFVCRIKELSTEH